MIVVDEQGNEYEATWPKRAKGLVKSGRARFVSENKICLACPPEAEKMEDKEMETAYSIEYILSQMEKIQQQTDYVNLAIEKLSQMGDGDSGDMHAPGNIQGEAKARAYADIVKSREDTNLKLLNLYEKMYDDLKPAKPDAKAALIEKLIETVANADSLDNLNADILNALATELAEKL